MKDIAYLKGSLADGHIYDLKLRIRIVVRQKNKEWLENQIAPILRSITGKEPKILKTLDGVYMIYVYVHKDKLKSRILDILMEPLHKIKFDNQNDEISFLKGFFDAEGSIYRNKKQKSDTRIIMYQKDKRVLEYIKSILEKLNIYSKIYGPYKNGKNDIFRLISFTNKNTERFLEYIVPLNKIKYNLL